jgi:hypothetical protein
MAKTVNATAPLTAKDVAELQKQVKQLAKAVDALKNVKSDVSDLKNLKLRDLKTEVGALKKDAAPLKRDTQLRLDAFNGSAKAAFAPTKVLAISSRISRPDGLATDTAKKVFDLHKGGDSAAKALIQKFNAGTEMTRLRTALDNTGSLDETNRLLLSNSDVFGAMLVAITKDKGDADTFRKSLTDRDGFRIALVEQLATEDGPRQVFFTNLATESLSRSGVKFDAASGEGKRLIASLMEAPVPLAAGRVDAAIEARFEAIIAEGPFPELVDAYAESKEIDSNRFTPQVKKAMVQHLLSRGVKIDTPEQRQRFAAGGYDEYFALAYDQAARAAAGDDDPIVSANSKGASVAQWDFQVDTFDAIEDQGIVKENILAAGALDYVFELGERLGIFRLADALTLNWAAGAIDVVDGPCASKLYSYWKLRDQRSDPSERGLVYKRVLNKGDVEALDRMVVNENFPELWGMLAEKVTEYRTKVETSKAEQVESLLVSRAPIYQAVRDLQFNLTEFCTGMAHMQVREMYSQLRDAMDLLGDPEIIDHFAGGRRKTMWTAIERLSKAEFGEAPNINAIRIAAVEGNQVFRFIATFRQGAVPEDEFQRFLEAMEAWIIAKATDDSTLSGVTDDADAEEDETEDDFDDATV